MNFKKLTGRKDTSPKITINDKVYSEANKAYD